MDLRLRDVLLLLTALLLLAIVVGAAVLVSRSRQQPSLPTAPTTESATPTVALVSLNNRTPPEARTVNSLFVEDTTSAFVASPQTKLPECKATARCPAAQLYSPAAKFSLRHLRLCRGTAQQRSRDHPPNGQPT